jgi:hypothetical protein
MKRKISVKWTSNLAYAIGLLVTDGNLSKDGRHITIVSKDLSQVVIFKRCLNINNKISFKSSGYSKRGKYYFVQFGNVKLYNWLLRLGLKPNKSKTISSLLIPNKFFPDFLRGHLDGDGSFRVYQDPIYPNSQRLYVRFMSASLKHLIWLQSKINSLLRIKGFIRRSNRAYELNYAKNESKILLPFIYHKKHLFYLERKKRIIEKFL